MLRDVNRDISRTSFPIFPFINDLVWKITLVGVLFYCVWTASHLSQRRPWSLHILHVFCYSARWSRKVNNLLWNSLKPFNLPKKHSATSSTNKCTKIRSLFIDIYAVNIYIYICVCVCVSMCVSMRNLSRTKVAGE